METKALAVTGPALFPSADELKNLKDLAQTFISSGLLPRAIDKPEKAIVVMLKGKEAGIAPLQALAHIHVIDGKPSMSAELMLSQLYKNIPGFAHEFLETSNTACRMKVKRPGSDWQIFSFTMQDAIAAGLTGKGPWKAYPAAMLRARNVSGMARAVGPDALAGISYTPEELGAEVDSNGAVLSASEGATDKVSRLKALNQTPLMREVASEVVMPAKAPIVEPAPKPEVKPAAVAPKGASWDEDLPAVSSPAYDPLADYVLQANHSFSGMKLRDIPRDELSEFLAASRAHFKEQKKEIVGLPLQDLTRIDDFLRATAGDLQLEPGAAG